MPFRLLVQCIDYYPEPVPEDLVFSTPDNERVFWILFYRKIQGSRGCVTIDPEATRALVQLLIRVNGASSPFNPEPFYWHRELDEFQLPFPEPVVDQGASDTGAQWLQTLDIPLKPGKRIDLEDTLRGWLTGHLDSGHFDLAKIWGPMTHIEWFANNVPYHVARRNIDLLVFHCTPPGQLIDPPSRYRYSVIELKRDWAEPDHIDQVVGYSQWVANRLAGGEVDMVRPYIVAYRFKEETIRRAALARFNRGAVRLVKYDVIDDSQLSFTEVSEA